jgi:hypothetical protein
VSPKQVYELARHLTEGDRVIALALYRRRAQDRLEVVPVPQSCC